MRCMFDFSGAPYVVLRGAYDPIITRPCIMIHIYIKHVYVEFYRGNTIFRPIILLYIKHISLMRPISELGTIMDRS